MLAVAALAAAMAVAEAQTAYPSGGSGDLAGWILLKQAEFFRALSGAVRAAKADGTAAWALFWTSFLYGIFHAAGPGHGKAVISSYLVANGETWRRGVILSVASALLQALVAIGIVGVTAVLLRMSAKTMSGAVWMIEIVGYSLIVLIGLRLVWVKGRALLRATRHADHDGDHHHDHGHACDGHAWGHAHAPEPDMLGGPGGWRRGLAAVAAVGLRPCSGAILVLVFSLAQGIFLAGIGATLAMAAGTAITVAAIATLAVGARGLAVHLADRHGRGVLVLRALEVAAAIAVTAFGALLLLGYIASERLMGF